MQPLLQKRIVPVILGPTATGKTYLSKLLSRRFKVEIISADSRQIYKYMDIGTAKPPSAFRQAVPHHFVDDLEPDEGYSAGRFAEDARKRIAGIFQR
ncbi:MAG: isopentenyl transferase family protein, partial [Calditrichia bacterium]